MLDFLRVVCHTVYMETGPLRTTLNTLRSQRVVTELRAHELHAELEVTAERLTHLRGAIENIEALLGEPSEEEASVLDENGARVFSGTDSQGATTRTLDFSNTPDPTPRFTIEQPAVRKRVPSTDWVAEVVDALGTLADRDTIYEKFEEMKGIPDSWVSNPRNSFNNALGRAVERRLIQKIGDEFAPRDWNPFEEFHVANREES